MEKLTAEPILHKQISPLARALRDYESAHAKYMSLSIFSDAGKKAKEEMKEKERIYIAAMKEAHPDWIIN